MAGMKALWCAVELAVAVAVLLAVIGPWGLLAVVALGLLAALRRALAVWQTRRRLIAAQEALQTATEYRCVADLELAEAKDRAREAGWYVPHADYSRN